VAGALALEQRPSFGTCPRASQGAASAGFSVPSAPTQPAPLGPPAPGKMKAKASLRQRGRHQGGSRPFGWTFGEATGAGRARDLVPDPVEQAAIADILVMRRAGATLRRIRDEMRARGHYISHNLVADVCRRGEAG